MAPTANLADLLAIQCAVLEEVADELVTDGFDEYAKRIRRAVQDADTPGDPLPRIKALVIRLRPVDYALADAMMGHVAQQIRSVRRGLAYEVDRYLDATTTEPRPRFSSGECTPPKD